MILSMDRAEAARLASELTDSVMCDGFDGYLFNSPDDPRLAVAALIEIGATRTAAIVRRAFAKFPGGEPPAEQDARQRALVEAGWPSDRFAGEDQEFFAYPEDVLALAGYARNDDPFPSIRTKVDADPFRLAAAVAEDPFALVSSADAEDREFGAFLMASQQYTTNAREALMRCLGDPSVDVAAVAAQSLALHSDVTALDAVLSLLEEQAGDSVIPVAWAAATLAALSDAPTRERARGALWRLRERGSPDVVRQVDILLGQN
jgi:hypothetical protein